MNGEWGSGREKEKENERERKRGGLCGSGGRKGVPARFTSRSTPEAPAPPSPLESGQVLAIPLLIAALLWLLWPCFVSALRPFSGCPLPLCFLITSLLLLLRLLFPSSPCSSSFSSSSFPISLPSPVLQRIHEPSRRFATSAPAGGSRGRRTEGEGGGEGEREGGEPP